MKTQRGPTGQGLILCEHLCPGKEGGGGQQTSLGGSVLH